MPKSCPDNFEHIYQLVMAEINRLNQRGMDAIAGYDAAIASARSQGFGHHEAIANECAAKFWIQRQKPGFAQIHLIRAWYGYQEWGAIAKTQQLQRCYGTLLSPISDTTPQQQPDLLTESLNFAMTLSPTTGGSSTTANLDTLSILQASQTLSSEIELDTLLANLLKLVIETAGADYCALLLHEEDELFVGATLQAGEPPRLMQMAPFEASDAVPNGLIRQVQRSQNPQVVSLVQQDSTLLQDPYIQTHQPQSLLGMPLLNQLSIRHKSA